MRIYRRSHKVDTELPHSGYRYGFGSSKISATRTGIDTASSLSVNQPVLQQILYFVSAYARPGNAAGESEDVTTGMTIGAHALHSDTLYRVGITVPLAKLTWAADLPGASEPISCYMLLAGDTAIFIDSGVKLMEAEVASAVSEVVGNRSLMVFPSRNEPDCIGNLGFLLGTGEDVSLLFGGGGGILEWIADPSADPLTDSSFLGTRTIVPASNGTNFRVGELEFEWMDAPVKEMFLTQWAYERTTETLFSSDFFGWCHQGQDSGDLSVTSIGELPSVAEIAAEIPLRFNWIPGAKLDEVIESFDRVLGSFPISIIAPVHGRPIVGPAVAAELIARTRSALLDLAQPMTAREGSTR